LTMEVEAVTHALRWVSQGVTVGRLVGKAAHKRLASWKISSVEELETPSAGTKPRPLHHRSPGGERRGKTIFLERTRERAIVNQTNIHTL